MFGNFFKPPHGDVNGIITPPSENAEEKSARLDAKFGKEAVMNRRGFLTGTAKLAGAAVVAAALPTDAMAKLISTENGVIDKKPISEKNFSHEDINKIFDKGNITQDDYYYTNILLSIQEGGKQIDSKFVTEKVSKGKKKIKVPVSYAERTPTGKGVYAKDYELDLPVSEEIKAELIKAKDGTNNGKIVKKVTGNGLIAEAETVKGRGWVILPPGTLLAKVDDKWCIASCLNPVYDVHKRPCPPCK
jgi:hypothetical protein